MTVALRKRRLPLARAIACALAFALAPQSHAADEAAIDRMTDAVVRMLPVGGIMEKAAAKDVAWPMGDDAGKVGAEKLACMRRELSADGYRRFKRQEVVEYAARHEATFAEDMKLAESVSPVLADIIAASIEGSEVNAKASMSKLSAGEMLAFITFAYEPKYDDLRQLAGYGEFPGEDGEKQDHKATEMLMVKMTFRAMSACDISPADVF